MTATDEHKAAVRRVADALIELNKATDAAGALGITIETVESFPIGSRNPHRIIAVSEIRELVLPG